MKTNSIVLILCAILPTICALSWAQDVRNDASNNPPDLDTIIKQARSMRLRLRQERISSVAISNDPNTKRDLEDYIKQLDALKLPETKSSEVKETIQPTRPMQLPKEKATPTVSPEKSTVLPPSKVDIPGKKEIYSRKIDALLEKPDNIVDPLAVADAIYKGGDLENAVKFYKLALKRMSIQKDPPHRSWALFQTANCLRMADSAEAARLYQQLISEFPNSKWTPAAMVQNTIITWTTANPVQFMEKYVSDPNSL